MSENNGPGFIDPSYGKEGLAAIPAPGLDPNVTTLQVSSAACAPDGSMAFYGYNLGAERMPGWFTRLDADGQWDLATGHVPVSTGQTEPHPEYLYAFTSMIYAVVDGEASYITASRVSYLDASGTEHHQVAIGRYQAEDFKPAVEFGDDGIALPEPFRSTRGDSMRRVQEREPKATDYRNTPKLGVIDGKIRVIFGGERRSTGSSKKHTWCALLDAKTGKPEIGLGPEGKDSQYRLSLIDDESTTLYHAEFLSEGGFLLLSSANGKIYLHRFLPNAMPDKGFASGQGYIVLSNGWTRAGMAVNDRYIVVSRGGSLNDPIGQPNEVYCYTLSGEEDSTFRHSPSVKGHTLILDHLSFDSQGRLVLAGQIYYLEQQWIKSKMQVVRYLSNGELDVDFGNKGYSPVNEYQVGSNGLYLDDQGIRVLTLMPNEPFYEQMVKLYS